MSLINDALKRAKQAQQQKPPDHAGGPPLRPVEPRPVRAAYWWLMPVFAVVAAAAAILLWQWFQQDRRKRNVPGHAVASVQNSPASSPVSPVVPAPQPAPPATAVSSPPAAPQPAVTAPALAQDSPLTRTNQPLIVPATSGLASNAAAGVAPAEAPARPAPLKLQGIIFHPTKPSAVIRGKLVFVGDRLGEWRVLAIDPENVTLVSGGKTNVLTLE